METYIKGEEIKVAINLEAPGFSMDNDDFIIEVKSGKVIITGYKNPPEGSSTDVIIFKETETVPPEEEGGEETTINKWYAIIDTKSLPAGTLVMIATAKILDTHANDGVRDSIATTQLCKLSEV